MRATFDTNVLVSAFISKQGRCADILDLVATFEEIELVLSEKVLSEFVEVISREEAKSRLGYGTGDIAQLEKAVRDIAEIVPIKSHFRVVEDDPDDDAIINAAIGGRAQYIVSGDRHLTRLKKFGGVRVVTPKAFLGVLAKKFHDLMLSGDDLGLE